MEKSRQRVRPHDHRGSAGFQPQELWNARVRRLSNGSEHGAPIAAAAARALPVHKWIERTSRNSSWLPSSVGFAALIPPAAQSISFRCEQNSRPVAPACQIRKSETDQRRDVVAPRPGGHACRGRLDMAAWAYRCWVARPSRPGPFNRWRWIRCSQWLFYASSRLSD